MNKTITLLALSLTMVVGAPAQAGGNAEAGKAKSAVCAGCHGADGNSPTAMFPKLAGQYEDYLYHSLKDYKTGKRKNPIMNGQVAGLSDQDMRDLAAFFAKQKGLSQKY
ncbi:MAG: cytochrome c [Pseudomonadota bacterium]